MEDIFAEADKAIDAKYGDQADGAVSTDQAPDAVKPTADQAPGSQESKGSSESQAIFELSQAKEFMLNGKKMTLKDLESQMMMHSDYTKKSQELSSFKKQAEYAMHWEADLPKLLDNPSLAAEFYRAYPKNYHPIIDRIIERLEGGQEEEASSASSMPTQRKLVQDLVDQYVGPIRDELDQYKTEAAIKQLDGIFSEMRGKYPGAEEEFVLARLEALKSQEVPINPDKIEEVFKHFHERDLKSKEAYHMEQIKKQQLASSKAKDVPSGGGIPGQAPKKFNLSSEKGWKDLEDSFKNHLQRQ